MATAVDDRCRALLRFGVYATLVLSPLPFGSVQPWAVLGLEILAAALGLGAVWVVAHDREALPRGARLVLVPALGLLAIGIVQLLPAPAWTVRSVAGPTAEARDAVAGVLVEVATTAAPLSLTPPETLDALLRGVSFGMIAFVTLIAFRERRHLKTVGFVIVASATFQALYGAAEYLSQHQHIFAYAKKYYLDCATGTFINRNHFATYLAMALPLALGMLIEGWEGVFTGVSWRQRLLRLAEPSNFAVIAAAVATFLIWIGVFLSYSRGGLAAALVATVVLGLLSGMQKRRLWVLAAACLLPAVFLSWQQMRAPGERFLADADRLTTLNRRLPVWEAGASMIPSYATVGVGWGNFGNAFQMYQPSSRLRWRHVHNDWLQTAIEGGVVAPVLLLWLLWLALTASRRTHGHPAPIRKCLTAGIVALAFHCILDFPLRIPAIGVLLACFIGLLCAREVYDADVRPLLRNP
jgi:O-antigen ligase